MVRSIPAPKREQAMPRPHRPRRSTSVVTVLLAGIVAAACGGAAGPPAVAAPALQVELVNSQLWPGRDEVLFDLLDEHWSGVAIPADQVAVTVRDPDGAAVATLAPERIVLGGTGRPLYRSRVDLARPGTWRLEVRTDLVPDPLQAELVVDADPPGTPAIGTRVPAIETPVGKGVTAPAASLGETVPDLERVSVADALAAGRPFLLVVDTLLVSSGDACGNGLSHVAHLAVEFPDMLMIHAEPYRTRVVDGHLVLDERDGAPVPAPWAAAWGATTPPWVFVVDRDGRLRAKFSGVMGTDELRAAIAAVEA